MAKKIRVEGRTFSFPDDATDEQIQSSLKRALNPNEGPSLADQRTALREAPVFTQIQTGVEQGIGQATQGLRSLASRVGTLGNTEAGDAQRQQIRDEPVGSVLPMTQAQYRHAGEGLGWEDVGELIPDLAMAAAGDKGLSKLFKLSQIAKPLARRAAQGAAAGAAPTAYHQLQNPSSGAAAAEMGLSVVVPVGGGKVADQFKKWAPKVLRSTVKPLVNQMDLPNPVNFEEPLKRGVVPYVGGLDEAQTRTRGVVEDLVRVRDLASKKASVNAPGQGDILVPYRPSYIHDEFAKTHPTIGYHGTTKTFASKETREQAQAAYDAKVAELINEGRLNNDAIKKKANEAYRSVLASEKDMLPTPQNGYGSKVPQMFMAPDSKIANMYAGVNPNTMDALEKYGDEASERLLSTNRIYPLKALAPDKEVDLAGALWSSIHKRIDQGIDKGRVIKYKNVADEGGLQDQIVITDPTAVKSRYEGLTRMPETPAVLDPVRRAVPTTLKDLTKRPPIPGEDIKLSAKPVGAAWSNLVESDENMMHNLLMNWNDYELSSDGTRILGHAGRDGRNVGNAVNAKYKANKTDFMKWVMSDDPFDPKTYGPDIMEDKEYVNYVEKARQIIRESQGLKPPVTHRKLADLSQGNTDNAIDYVRTRFAKDFASPGTRASKEVQAEVADALTHWERELLQRPSFKNGNLTVEDAVAARTMIANEVDFRKKQQTASQGFNMASKKLQAALSHFIDRADPATGAATREIGKMLPFSKALDRRVLQEGNNYLAPFALQKAGSIGLGSAVGGAGAHERGQDVRLGMLVGAGFGLTTAQMFTTPGGARILWEAGQSLSRQSPTRSGTMQAIKSQTLGGLARDPQSEME